MSGVRRPASSSLRPSSFLSGSSSVVRRPASGVWRLVPGFTLIEVLVAMAVLAVLVLMAANIFQSSSIAWNIGTQKSDMNTAARAALDFMARELELAVAGPIDTIASGAKPALTFNLLNGNDVRFVSLAGEPGGNSRALQASLFRYYNNQLQYKRETDASNPYTDPLPNWASFPHMLITNVLSLQIIAFTNEFGLANGLFTENFDSSALANSNQLPICVDIALEMMSDDDMRRYIATGNDTNFAARNAKLYTTRVYFPNRVGYGGR